MPDRSAGLLLVYPAAVSRELRWMRSLLKLLEYNAQLPWSLRVFALDASEWGRGVCRKDLDPVPFSRWASAWIGGGLRTPMMFPPVC